ncbi:MAG: tetratricopeptide repeat protein [Pirellulaceae bacterium]|nr:tetratricopeptide repeat protein [Pirellulaceae bacterium]
MPMFVCALSLCIALLLEPISPTTPERELYQSAATAIAARDLPRATEQLEQLVSDYADGELAPIAAYHLAQCLLLDQHAQRALDVLAHWTPRIERKAATDSTQTRLLNETYALLAQVIASLDGTAATQTTLEILLSAAEVRHSPKLMTAVASELARRSQRNADYGQALSYLRQAADAIEEIGGAVPAELPAKLYFELPLSWAEHELSNGHALAAVDVLEQTDAAALSSEQALAVRFLLAEALFAAGKHEQAAEQFDWLAQQAEEQTPKPEWLAAIALRRGELLVRARDIPAARRWLLQAKQEHAEFARGYEFDYLLARCAVAQIEFDEARELLQQVLDAPAAKGTEAAPRAAWMLGEVYFLQRQYPQALEAYAQVARMNAFPDWQARALLQSAKCHELLGRASQALADYQRALQLSQQPDIQQQATERVGAIESLSPTLR